MCLNLLIYSVNILNQKHNKLITYYTETISTYENAEYEDCIGNCRNIN